MTTAEILDRAKKQGWLSGLDFSLLIHNLTVSEGRWVIPVGNYENVNAEIALRLVKRIKKHPRIWKMFFMVA